MSPNAFGSLETVIGASWNFPTCPAHQVPPSAAVIHRAVSSEVAPRIQSTQGPHGSVTLEDFRKLPILFDIPPNAFGSSETVIGASWNFSTRPAHSFWPSAAFIHCAAASEVVSRPQSTQRPHGAGYLTKIDFFDMSQNCLLYTSPSPRD